MSLKVTIDNAEPGFKVVDNWFIHWGMGVIKKVLKTRVVIEFSVKGEQTYDKQHLQFLTYMEDDYERSANKQQIDQQGIRTFRR